MFEACPIGEVNRQYRWEQKTQCYRVQDGCTGYVDVDMDSVRNERRDARIRCDACKGGFGKKLKRFLERHGASRMNSRTKAKQGSVAASKFVPDSCLMMDDEARQRSRLKYKIHMKIT